MKTIMAIYLFRWDVQEMKKQPNDPADFAKYLYQPEKDDETKSDTGKKEQYRDFDLPSFNEPTGEGVTERLDKVKLSRRGDPGVFVANRAYHKKDS